ncbi:hypothetical protein EB796_005500 [Bugula neritina]|uniref:Uncharacterized protein n=1 Tax=Bugula neritina TaxID=10212 RepID=A0A7J7KD49_BUGNE|nr:hypothetical protein EB796_005500 [Bugula neritina]
MLLYFGCFHILLVDRLIKEHEDRVHDMQNPDWFALIAQQYFSGKKKRSLQDCRPQNQFCVSNEQCCGNLSCWCSLEEGCACVHPFKYQVK